MLSKGETLLLNILDKELPHYAIISQCQIMAGYKRLYLDYYIPQLKLAFEFDGRQHSEFVKFFHKTLDGFTKSLKRDSLKEKYCKENGITLVHISDDEQLTIERVRWAIFNTPIYKD